MKSLALVLIGVLAACGGDEEKESEEETYCAATASVSGTVRLTPFGCPTWEFTDAQIFSADAGAGGENVPTLDLALLNPVGSSIHQDIAGFGVGPGDAHDGPYDGEFTAGLGREGITAKSTFSEAEFSPPNAVWIVLMAVPTADAPSGKSPDSASGPIIPEDLYPMTFSAGLLESGSMWDPFWGGSVPAISEVMNDSTLEGYSHMPMFFIDNNLFGGHDGEDASGSYELLMSFRDASHNGWTMEATYTVN